jgi:hypothetical protein
MIFLGDHSQVAINEESTKFCGQYLYTFIRVTIFIHLFVSEYTCTEGMTRMDVPAVPTLR